MISAHSLVFIASLYFLVPALKSARYTHLGNVAFAEHNYEGAVKSYEIALSSNGYAAFLHQQMLDSLAQRDDKSGELGLMRRMGPLGMILGGGYAAKKAYDRNKARKAGY